MNTQSIITRTTIVFAALAITGIVVAASAQFVMSDLEQTILVALGSAVFGAALAFFLIRLFSLGEK